MRIDQLTPAINMTGDSISNYVFGIRDLLIELGYKSNIYIENKDFSFSGFVKDYRKCKVKKEDIVILHATIGSNLTNFFRNLKCKKMIIYHGHTPAKFFNGVNNKIFKLLESYDDDLRSLIGTTDYVLCDSEFNKQDLEKIGFRDIKVNPIFINFNRFKEINQAIADKFNDDYINISCIGRIIPNKKIQDTIKIFYYYKNFINSKSRLFIVGSISNDAEKYYKSLVEYISKLKLRDVYFTNKVSDKDLASYYKSSDIFLCMSEHEGLGLPLIEAMYFDIPIIAFNSTAVPYTLDNAGILVDKKDFKKIAELINTILINEDLKYKIIEGQKERLKYFDNEKLKKQCLQHIMNVKNSTVTNTFSNSINEAEKFEKEKIPILKNFKLFKKKAENEKIGRNKYDSYDFVFNHPESVSEIKILYIQPKGVGDIIMSTPIIRCLKKKYPYALIDFAADDYCKDIIIDNPYINKVYSFDKLPNLQEYIQVLRPYLKTQYMINWQNSGIHIVDLYASLCGIRLDSYKTDIFPIKVNLGDYGIKENEDYICLHIQSSLKYKDWPYFKELIDKIKDKFKVVVIDEQQHNYKHTIQLPPDIKLREKAYIISKSKMLIGIDSMGIHMASAFQIPTIALYGNTLPDLCKPLSNKNLIAIEPKERCTEGWHHFCKEGNYCINNITVNEVLEKLEELMLKCKIY